MLLTDVFAGLAVLALYLVVLRARARCALGALGADRADRVLGRDPHARRLRCCWRCSPPALVVALFRRGIVPSPGCARRARASRSASRCCSPPIRGRRPRRLDARRQRDPVRPHAAGRHRARYLAEHCPDPRLPKLCEHRDELPDNADVFFWGDDLFDGLGRFEGLGEEMRIVMRESLAAYPAASSRPRSRGGAAARARRNRLRRAHRIWHTNWIIETSRRTRCRP